VDRPVAALLHAHATGLVGSLGG